MTAPWFLGGVALLIGALVVWAFWPAPVDEIERELADGEHVGAGSD